MSREGSVTEFTTRFPSSLLLCFKLQKTQKTPKAQQNKKPQTKNPDDSDEAWLMTLSKQSKLHWSKEEHFS